MRSIRIAVICSLFAGVLASLAMAQDAKFKKPAPKPTKIDPAKLIGLWELEEEPAIQAEFTSDGAHHVFTTTKGEKKIGAKGTYKLAADQLTVTADLEGKSVTEVYQIKQLTDNVLVYQIPGEKAPTRFLRKKPAVASKEKDPAR
jgi:uncharacterized protein (TIGR03066 family)